MLNDNVGRYFRKIVWVKFVFLGLFLAGSAHAAPSVQEASGKLDHKGTVTLSGLGFGSKANAAPVVWDDASGNNILDNWDGAWPNNNTTYNLAYRSPMRGIALPHNHITRYIAGAHGEGRGADGGYNVIMFKYRRMTSYPQYTYASWYERADDKWSFGGDNNYKTFAFSTGNTPYNLPINWYLAANTPKPDSTTSSAQYILGDDSWNTENQSLLLVKNGVNTWEDVNGHTHWWGSLINPMSGVWKKVELEIKWTDQNDGYIKLRENGSRTLSIDYLGPTDKYPGADRTEGIGGYVRNYGTPSNWRYWADVYLDYSRARVVLTNNVNYDSSTIIEPQIPSSWSDKSVAFTVNLGAIPAGQTAYLFVFDPSGRRNAEGFPVIAGGQLTGVAPPLPPSTVE